MANIRLGASGGIYTPTAIPQSVRGGVDPYEPYQYPPLQDSPMWPGLSEYGGSGNTTLLPQNVPTRAGPARDVSTGSSLRRRF